MSFAYRPMLAGTARPGELEARLSDSRYIGEPKIDGWRLLAGIVDGEIVVYAGRNAADYTGRLPLIEHALEQLPDNTILDGEIVHHRGIQVLNSAMRTERPYQHDDLQFAVFDVLRCAGVELTEGEWFDRHMVLDELAHEAFMAPRVRSVPLVPVTVASLQVVLAQGFEGLVVKDRFSRYVQGRSQAWLKIKPQDTSEARVIGAEAGKDSFAGLVGALEFELIGGRYDGVRSTCSGFNMALRQDMTAIDPQTGEIALAADWQGAIITIKHHGFFASGAPRHPQFKVRRYDLEQAA